MISNLVVIFITILLGLIFSDPKIVPWSDEVKRKRYIWIISIILILQSGLRNVAVGADTYAYFKGFERVKQMDWHSVVNTFTTYYLTGVGKDPGYTILQKAFQTIIENYQIFLLTIALLFFIALGNFIYRNTIKLSETVFAFVLYSTLFYSFFSITGHRQTIATASVLFAFEFLKKRKFFPFLIIILTASTIHISCLIFIPFYFLANIKSPRLILSIILLMFPILYLNSGFITSLFYGFVPQYEQYGHYENLKPYIFTTMMILVGIVATLFSKNLLTKNPNASQYFIALAMAIFFLSQVFEIHAYMRIVQYYSIFIIILIPLLIYSLPISNENLKKIIINSVLIILLVLYINGGGSSYRFFWQEMELGPNYSGQSIH